MSQNEQKAAPRKSLTKKSLLVVGDWVVDDNLLTGIHRSNTSLRTGQIHYRTLAKPGCPVQSFCGAGRLASILDSCESFNVTGLGVWRSDKASGVTINDTQYLQNLFDFDFRRRQHSAALNCGPEVSATKVKLHNLAEILANSTGNRDVYTTTHVFRLFQRRGEDVVLVARTDTEHGPTGLDVDGIPAWVRQPNVKGILKLLDKLKPDVVIIKDLMKGVVSRDLISMLADRFANRPWFISTKRWDPPWLEVLKKKRVNLKLLMFPHIAAGTALREGLETPKNRISIDSWIVPANAMPTKEGMEVIAAIENKTTSKGRTPVILISPQEGSVIAKKGVQFIAWKRSAPKGSALVGWATAFYAALSANLIDEDACFARAIDEAMKYSSTWAESEYHYLNEPDQDTPEKPATLVRVDCVPTVKSREELRDWDKDLANWIAATTDRPTPVVTGKSPRKLELWRSMTIIDQYICLDPDKRKQLSRLVNTIKRRAAHLESHQAGQLVAPPGSGKSFLMKQLAKSCGLEMLEFNVTHLNRREEISSWFDTIVTAQTQKKDRPWLVFVDEIDAQVQGHHVFDAFLTPLEDSIYVRGGSRFHIKPCIWIFAGTSDKGKLAAVNKYPDFYDRIESRLGTVVIRKMSRLEQRYVAAQMIRRLFPDVRVVTKQALDQIVGPKKEERNMRQLRSEVEKLQNVQGAIVRLANIPDPKRKLGKENEIQIE